MNTFIKIVLLSVAMYVGIKIGNAAIDYAFLERGYSALGGEIFVMPCAFICTYYLLEFAWKTISNMNRKS